jgi:signal transduction histidine kinase
VYETGEHIIQKRENIFSFNLMGEVGFFGIAGPTAVFFVLYWIRHEWRERALAQRQLDALHRERGELVQKLIAAQEEERQRVARDLHDDLGQDLAVLAVNVESADRLLEEQPKQARAQLKQIRAMVAEITNHAYDMILSLRPSALDDLGLVPALRAHAERALKGAGIQFELDSRDLTHRLPPEIETTLFRVFQEAFNNIVRHSAAKRARLIFVTRDGLFKGEIADDGRGFNLRDFQPNGNSARGLGLLGMQERVAQCGGTLEVASQVGGGTRIKISIPIPEARCE